MKLTTRHIALVVLTLVLVWLFVLMVTDEPASGNPYQSTISRYTGDQPDEGMHMDKLLAVLGGSLVGGGAVIIYAKATGQALEWRRKALFRWIAFIAVGIPPTEDIPGTTKEFRGVGSRHCVDRRYRRRHGESESKLGSPSRSSPRI